VIDTQSDRDIVKCCAWMRRGEIVALTFGIEVNDDGEVTGGNYVTIEKMCRDTGVSRSMIRRSIAGLESRGLLQVIRVPEEG